MARIFGFQISRDSTKDHGTREVFSPKVKDDGALSLSQSDVSSTFLNVDGALRSEGQLITKYRELSLQPEIQTAIDEITNEAIAYDEKPPLVEIDLDAVEDEGSIFPISKELARIIRDEFSEILRLLDFNNSAYELFKRWYTDGRLYQFTVIDQNAPEEGIKEIRYVDPRQIHKVRVSKEERASNPNMPGGIIKDFSEFYVYTPNSTAIKPMTTMGNGINGGSGFFDARSIKISRDAMVDVTSGLTDPTNTIVLSYLQRSMKPLNMLRAIEDASLIHRLVRAPMRRLFNVEVGGLSPSKGEEYLKDQMTRYKNHLNYNSESGQILGNRHYMTMIEDYWFATRGGKATTTVTNLPGAADWNSFDDLNYFREQLYQSLNVPIDRLRVNSMFQIGDSQQTSRDELRFGKFIDRLRLRFSGLFKQLLAKQLILKGILNSSECEKLISEVSFDFKRDSHFTELKEAEIIQRRLQGLNLVDPYINKFFSRKWVQKNILQMTDDEIDEMDVDIDEYWRRQEDSQSQTQIPDGGTSDQPGDQEKTPGDKELAPVQK